MDKESEISTSWNLSDVGFSSSRTSMYDILRSLIINNIEYYQTDTSKNGRAFAESFDRYLINLNEVEHLVNDISRFAHEYDYDSSVPGNGYRSMISVVDSCVMHSIQLCRTVCLKRNSFIFRRDILDEIKSYCDLMGCLSVILRLTQRLKALSEPHKLFPSDTSPVDLLLEADNIDTTCFYGRCLGFQFHESLKSPLTIISIMMASFSDAYYNTGGMITRTASSIVSCGKYSYSPELRAERIVEVARKASVDFCKSFWLLQEHNIVQQVPGFVCASVQVNKVIQVPITTLKLKSQNGQIVDIPCPKSHVAPSPVICRLLSASLRLNQLSKKELENCSTKVKGRSPGLIIQCHGGGFVAQSSKSHEVYLRDWAVKLDVPIFCIDYSLAPDAPYPRALEECFYAYAWALKNAHYLGSSAKKICFVGDSAGGNLLCGVIMKSIELGIRVPDGFLSMYTPFIMSFLPSPSRLLCLMDPLLPFGFMMRCLKAYAGHSCENTFGGASASREVIEISSEASVSHEVIEKSSGTLVSHEVIEKPSGSSVSHEVIEKPSGSSVSHEDIETLSDGSVSDEDIETPSKSSDSSFEDDQDSEFQMLDETSEVALHGQIVTNTDVNLCNGVMENAENKNHNDYVVQNAENMKLDDHFVENKKKDDYVSKFMSWCIPTQNCIDVESTEDDENILFEMPIEFPFRLPRKMNTFTGKLVNGFSSVLSSVKWKDSSIDNCKPKLTKRKSYNGIFADRSLNDSGSLVTILEEFKKFTVTRDDPYISPYYASDSILQKFPSTYFLSTELDPCLDDTVMFSKRLRALGCDVHVDILDHLPHGFLNLILVSKDAQDGSNLAVNRLRSLLKLDKQDNVGGALA